MTTQSLPSLYDRLGSYNIESAHSVWVQINDLTRCARAYVSNRSKV
jgi:hypothetical protein